MSENSVKFRNLDLNLLVALDALLTERSVTRAGERVFRSQSAMSGILARLRQFFGDELLIRVGNNIELTPTAEQLKVPIREFISVAQYIANFKPSLDPRDLEQMFVVAMSDYAADFILPKVMKMLSEEAPKVRVRLRTVDYDYWSALEARETDYVILPTEMADERGVAEIMLTERWVCIADADRHRRDSLSVAQFEAHPMIAVSYYDGRTQMAFERELVEAGLRWSAVATVPYFQMLPRLIAGSDYLAIIHERTALREKERFNLKILDLPLPIRPLSLSLAMHERNNHSAPHLWFKSLLRQASIDFRS